jgi:hypothetical protein
MMKAFFLGLVAAFGVAGVASAATVVVSADTNGTVLKSERSDTSAVLDGDVSTFYSLGVGGSLVLDFGYLVGSPGYITEVTYNSSGYYEALSVYVSETLDFSDDPVAYVTNQGEATSTISFETDGFRYLFLVDDSDSGYNRDGFDIAEISFSPVPVPAAGLLLGGALLGLGATRRRVKKSA